MAVTIQNIVSKQIDKVLKKGSRLGNFNQIRQRHFWSTYLFIADPTTSKVPAGTYDIFKTIPGASGQGYPTNINLTLRETNWLNAGRVPDNQSFAIQEIGVTIRNPPIDHATPANQAATSIYANLSTAQKAYLAPGVAKSLSMQDAYNIAFGTVLEMSFLTNNVPLGLIGDFSQSAGIITPPDNTPGLDANDLHGNVAPAMGLACAAFRRKFEIPILLSSGENMGMRLTVPRDIQLINPNVTTPPAGTTKAGKGWYEIRVDWFAIESFVEKS